MPWPVIPDSVLPLLNACPAEIEVDANRWPVPGAKNQPGLIPNLNSPDRLTKVVWLPI